MIVKNSNNIPDQVAAEITKELFRHGAGSLTIAVHDTKDEAVPHNKVMGIRSRQAKGWEMIFMDVPNITLEQLAAFLDEAPAVPYKHILVSTETGTRFGFTNTPTVAAGAEVKERRGIRPGIISFTLKQQFSTEDGKMKNLSQLAPQYTNVICAGVVVLAVLGAFYGVVKGSVGLAVTMVVITLIFAFLWAKSRPPRNA